MPGRPISAIQQLNNDEYNDEMNGNDLTEAMVDAVENDGDGDDTECLVEI